MAEISKMTEIPRRKHPSTPTLGSPPRRCARGTLPITGLALWECTRRHSAQGMPQGLHSIGLSSNIVGSSKMGFRLVSYKLTATRTSPMQRGGEMPWAKAAPGSHCRPGMAVRRHSHSTYVHKCQSEDIWRYMMYA